MFEEEYLLLQKHNLMVTMEILLGKHEYREQVSCEIPNPYGINNIKVYDLNKIRFFFQNQKDKEKNLEENKNVW